MNSKFLRLFVVFGCLFVSIAACAPGGYNKQAMGTGIGAALGGALGSNVGKGNGKTAATIVGAIIGGLLGGTIGSYMDEADRMQIGNALGRVPTGQTVGWVNHGGTNYVSPTSNIFTENGQHCRKYQAKIIVDGNYQTGESKACRRNDGYWDI